LIVNDRKMTPVCIVSVYWRHTAAATGLQ